MKNGLRKIFLNFLSLLLISKIIGGISFNEDYLILFWAALSLTLLNLLIKPVLNLLLMPINLLTLGASRWIVNVLVLLMVTLIVSDFKIVSFTFPGVSFSGFVIPKANLSFFWVLILVSFLIDIVFSFFEWLLH